MPSVPPASPTEPTPRRGRRSSALLLAAVAALVVLQAPGCSCRTETEPERVARLAREEAERLEREKKRLEEERRLLPVQLGPVRTQPFGEGAVSLFVKPGHWNAVVQPAKANAEDFDGRLTLEVVGRENAPRPIPGASKRLRSERPLVVARESQKAIEALFYCPPTKLGAPRLRAVVLDRRSGALVSDFATPLRPLLDHQYHFVVLSNEPGRYAFLDSLYSFTAALETAIDDASVASMGNAMPAAKNYRLVAPPLNDPSGDVALPDTALAWTSIAYVLWDGVDPASLRPEQREALVDWLNWGGQLIVSGPDSLDLLRGSFLEPLLPARSVGAREITTEDLGRLDASWSAAAAGEPLNGAGGWAGVRLKTNDGAAMVAGAGPLIAERRVGRGRIVVSAFQLNDPRLLDWRAGVDNLFNAALLRRPPRRFVPANSLGAADGPAVAVRWDSAEEPFRFDPLLNTGLRGFVRDTHANDDQLALRLIDEGGAGGGASPFRTVEGAPVPGGAGGLNDYNAAASAVRAALRESAGVSVPGSGFVIACLSLYLFALVPLNWLFFYAIGRVELAWAAAPLIALAGAWVVIQQAQLDIGFVRAQTEVAVLELQPDTPRGMLTRFTALYTSLSTTYEVEFDAPAVATPFPAGEPDAKLVDRYSALVFERQEKTRLRNLAVASASTELIRSEEMFDVSAAGVPGSSVPGSITVTRGPTGDRLTNRTAWTLEETMVVRRPAGVKDGPPRLEGCWVGRLESAEVADVVFLPIDTGFARADEQPLPFEDARSEAIRLRSEEPEQRLRLDELTRLALDPARFEPGESRVVARIEGILPGVRVEPAASQQRGATLLVSHLRYGALPPPRSDANAPIDVR